MEKGLRVRLDSTKENALLVGIFIEFYEQSHWTAPGRVDMKRENKLKGDKMRAERRKQQVRLQHPTQSGSDTGVLVMQVRKEDVQEASLEVLTHREIGEATRKCSFFAAKIFSVHTKCDANMRIKFPVCEDLNSGNGRKNRKNGVDGVASRSTSSSSGSM